MDNTSSPPRSGATCLRKVSGQGNETGVLLDANAGKTPCTFFGIYKPSPVAAVTVVVGTQTRDSQETGLAHNCDYCTARNQGDTCDRFEDDGGDDFPVFS